MWAGLSDLGVPGMLIAEEHGGIGLSLLDAALVAETLGSRVAPAPFVATVVMVPIAIAVAGSEDATVPLAAATGRRQRRRRRGDHRGGQLAARRPG